MIEAAILKHESVESTQTDYVQVIETMMKFTDTNMRNGSWNVIHTKSEMPFVIGDAPVVTWDRKGNQLPELGVGFGQPNVEVLLPISPTSCLHVLPQVQRTRHVQNPLPQEVNIAQAAFATKHCFASIASDEIDSLLQPHFETVRLGIEGFSINHIDYKRAAFEILMGRHRASNT